MTELLSDIERILWKEWDPIGVNVFPEAFGEYDAYAFHIFGMLCAPTRASVHEIEAYLNMVRTDYMGLYAAPDSDRAIADRLSNLHKP